MPSAHFFRIRLPFWISPNLIVSFVVSLIDRQTEKNDKARDEAYDEVDDPSPLLPEALCRELWRELWRLNSMNSRHDNLKIYPRTLDPESRVSAMTSAMISETPS